MVLFFAAWPAFSVLFYGYSRVERNWYAALSALLFVPTVYWLAVAGAGATLPARASNLLSLMVIGLSNMAFVIGGALVFDREESFDEAKYWLAAGWILAMGSHAIVLNLRAFAHAA